MISLVAILIIIAAIIAGGIIWGSATATPKLALDLEGGTEIMLQAQTDNGKPPSANQMQQAVSIMRSRVDASGVSEAQITTVGSRNIDISLPGNPSQATLNLLKASAKLEFRQVLMTNDTGTATTTTPTSLPALTGMSAAQEKTRTEVGSEVVAQFAQFGCREYKASVLAKQKASEGTTSTTASGAASASASASASSSALPTATKSNTQPSNPIPEQLSVNGVSRTDLPLLTCDTSSSAKYLLGPVQRVGSKATGKPLDGTVLSDASAGVATTSNGASTNNWVVNMTFNSVGKTLFGDVTGQLATESTPLNRFAIVLDGRVITAPSVSQALTSGQAQIEGGFTQATAQSLADQLKYGSLPISFTVQSQDKITPTLGSQQLAGGMIAGAIGLLLVIAYSLFQYRALGLVTVMSLAIAAITTFLLIDLMSWAQGYRLSLSGVAGLIVAIGITADSFIVYFERFRDELRDGHSLVTSVEFGWKRAIRTILASDGINLLAAIVLFVVTVGNVRGFAFTLGLTTIVDVMVVALFTHPTMQLLANTKFFGQGHRFSGLNPTILGAAYRGRGSFRPVDGSEKHRGRAAGEAQRRMTIAERKRAEALQENGDVSTTDHTSKGEDD